MDRRIERLQQQRLRIRASRDSEVAALNREANRPRVVEIPTQRPARPVPKAKAKFPVPQYPGRAQYGSRPLEILGADLIIKEKSTLNVPGNKRNKLLQENWQAYVS